MKAHPSVLIVDDEPDNFDVIETLLHGENYQLHYASNGQKALDRLATLQPDVILMDAMMPEVNGIQTCQQIKAMPQWQMIPIIMVTALTGKADLAKCLAAGADDFISKPVDGVELRARIGSMLRLKHQYDNLQNLLQLREDMVNMMVHDLRNPLSSVMLSVEILRLPGLTPEHRQVKIDQIAIAATQLQFLIDSLLMMAKLESGKMVLNRTAIDLCALCVSAVADFEAIAAQKSLELITQLPEPGGCISVDAAIFRRVLDNLLSNAIKFSPQHSQIVLHADYPTTHSARVQIADAGPGINDTLKQQIFEKYEIGTLMNDVSQIGLGLAFCKMAIEAHGGDIAVTENQPQGTIFTVSVPAASNEQC